MTNYIKRLIYVDAENNKINPLFYPFLITMHAYAIGFAFGGSWSGVYTSSMYQSFYSLYKYLPVIWGISGIIVLVMVLLVLVFRLKYLAGTASMLAIVIWMFSGIVYIINGYWLAMLTVSVPNTYFWIFYYFASKRWQRRKDDGEISDP